MSRRLPARPNSVLSRALRAFRRVGPRDFIGLLVANLKLLATGRYWEHRYAYDRSFDREHGVDTSGTVGLEELDVPEALRSRAVRYEPVDPDFFIHVVERARIDDRSKYLFVDLGSGKARSLLLAAQAQFRRLIGVELDPALNAIALRNIDVFAKRHPLASFTQITGDAAEFEFPPVPTVLFLNNPFDEFLLRKVVGNVERTHGSPAADFVLLYLHSIHERMMRSRAGWEEIDSGTFRSRRQFYSIFRWRGGAIG